MTKYYAPQFSVRVNGSELTADISHNVQQIAVVKNVDSAQDTCTLTIANPAPRMRWTHTDDADLFWIGAEILVAMGYVDDIKEVMVGVITGVSATFPDSAMPTINVTCSSKLQKLNGDQQTRTFTGKNAKEIVESVGMGANLKVQAEDPGVTHDYIIQANQTDFQFLRSIAERVHYELLVVDDTLYFRPPKETEDKLYTFVWSPTGHYSSDQDNTLPLKSFNPDANALKQQYTETETYGYDDKTKQGIRGKGSSGDVKKAGSQGGTDVRKQALGSHKRAHVTTPIRSQAEADEHAKGAQGKSEQQFVVGTGHTVGVPDLKPGSAIELKGLGLWEGTYYVSKVTHTISNSGYITDFVVQRNATNAK
jgi:uncharacterized protein